MCSKNFGRTGVLFIKANFPNKEKRLAPFSLNLFSGLQVVTHHVLPNLAAIAQTAVVASALKGAALAEVARLLFDGVLVTIKHVVKEKISCGASDSLDLLVLSGGHGEEAHGSYLSVWVPFLDYYYSTL